MLLGSNGELAYGLGFGFGATFFYLPEQFQSELELLTKSNIKLDDGLGSGIGFVLKHLQLKYKKGSLVKPHPTMLLQPAWVTGLGIHGNILVMP